MELVARVPGVGAERARAAEGETLRVSLAAEPMLWVAYALGAGIGALLLAVPIAPVAVAALAVHLAGTLVLGVALASAGLQLASSLPGAAHVRLRRDGLEIRHLWRTRTVPWTAVAGFRVVHTLRRRAVGYDLAPWRRHLHVVGVEDDGPLGLLPPIAGHEPEALARKLEAWRSAAAGIAGAR